MDNNTSNQQLNQIVSGQGLPSVPAISENMSIEESEYIVEGKKLKNELMKYIVDAARERKMEDSLILDVLVRLDKDIEAGLVTTEDINKELGVLV